MVLSRTFSGFCTHADRRDCTVDFISSDIHTSMPQRNYVIITSGKFLWCCLGPSVLMLTEEIALLTSLVVIYILYIRPCHNLIT